MRKLLIGVVVIIAAIAAIVVVGPSFVDWNAYKGQLAAQVEAATGRRLSIDGDLSLSILPTPRLSASGVRLGNIEGASSPDMIRLDTARVIMALGPLTQGKLEVESLELIEPRIELERLADGRTNWSLQPSSVQNSGNTAASSRNAGGFSVPEIRFNDIRVRGGELTFRDQTTGIVEHIENVNADIVAGSLEGPFRAEGDFTTHDLPLQIRLAIGRLAEERAVPVSVVLGVGADTDTAEFSGVLSGFPNEARLNGSLALRSENAGALITAFTGKSSGVADSPAVVEGDLTISPAGISLNDTSIRLADTSGTGAVQYTFADTPRLDIVLNVGQVDLDRLRPPAEETGAASEQPDSSEKPKSFFPGRSGEDFTLPKGIDASLEAKIDALVLNGGIVRQVQFAADLADGELSLNQVAAQLPGGSDISLFGLVTATEGKPVFDGQLEANSDNFRALLNWLKVDVGDVPAGRLRKFELAAKVKATPEELTVSGIDMQIDLSSMRGGVAVALRERKGFGIGLSIDRINLDAYLPPVVDNAAVQATESETTDQPPSAAPVFAPLAFLDTFDAILQLQVGSLTLNGTPVSGIGFDGTLQRGILDLRQAAVADFAGAGINASGRISGLGQRPSADLEIAVDASDATRFMRAIGISPPVQLRAAKLEGTVAGDMDQLRFNARLLAVDGEVKVEGNLAGLDTDPTYSVSIDAAHPSFNALIAALSNFPKTAGDPGQLALNGNISGNLTAADVDLSTRLGEGSFALEGSLANMMTGASGDLALELRHPSLTTLARTFWPDYRPALADLGEFHLSTDLSFDPESVKMAALNGAVGPVALQGEADLAYRPDEPPLLIASLSTSEIILEWFLAPVAIAAGALDNPPADSASPSRDNSRWSRQPFDFAFLNNLDAQIDLSAPALNIASYSVGNPDISLQIDDGQLQLSRFAGALFGGTLSVTGDIAAAQPPELNLIMSVAGADAPQMIAAARAGKNQGERSAVSGILELLFPVAALDLSSGTLGSDLAISSTGRSEFELISNLAGSGEVTFTDAVVDGTDLCRISNQLDNLNGLDGFLGLLAAGEGGETRIDDFIGRFDLARGVATLPNQDIRSECAAANFAGTIDLPRWRIDTRANVTFPEHDDFPGLVLEEKGSLDAPNARLVNVNAIQQYLIAKAASNALRNLVPAPTAPVAEPVTAPVPAQPAPEQPALPILVLPDTLPPQPEPAAPEPQAPEPAADEPPPAKPDPFKNLLDALTR